MRSAETEPPTVMAKARRDFEVCNACRYCEGFCAVFPAMMRRRQFSDGDLRQLANLCHNCKGCFYACQYAPPHEFGVNLPQVLARVRTDSYARYAWPRPVAAAYRRNGVVVATVTTLLTAAALLLLFELRPDEAAAVHTGPGAFYAVVPWAVMSGVAAAALLFALMALAIGGVRFWRDGGGGAAHLDAAAVATGDVLTLRYLGGGHGGRDGCNDRDDGFSHGRRAFHHALFYGFGLCFAATVSAWGTDTFLGLVAPYPFLSLPVILGTAGGIAMMIGSAGMLWLKAAADPEPAAHELLGADYALLWLLLLTAASGLALMLLRETASMGVLLVGHLGLVVSLFLLAPYSKMAHGVYRSLALLRDAAEEKSPAGGLRSPTRQPRFTITRSGPRPRA